MTTAYTDQAHRSETAAKQQQKSSRPQSSCSRPKSPLSICSGTKKTASSFRTTWLLLSDSTKSSAPASPSLTSIHTTQTTGIQLGTTAIIQVPGATGAIMTRGTMADTAGTSDGTQVSTTLGTTILGTQVSTTLTTITCIHTIADGMVDGGHTLEESTIGHITEADTL